jgi:ketosteroid isomerase-like protein
MSESAETAAQAFVDAINRQDVKALFALMTPGHRFIDPLGQVVEGREKMRAAWSRYFGMVPDYALAIEEVHVDGQVVVMLGEAGGTYAPGGKVQPENRWKTPAAWRARVENGKVAEWRVYADNEPMRRLMAGARQGY